MAKSRAKARVGPVELRALRLIRNAVVHDGRGPSVRKLGRELGYSSPRTAAGIINRLIAAGHLKRRSDQTLQILGVPEELEGVERTVPVPLVGMAPCGAPLLAIENIEAMVPVSTKLARPGYKYFLLRAVGHSMDRAGIEDGALVLVRQQSTAETGQIVVALVDDEATIKEFRRSKDAIILQPRSSEKNHQPILLTRDFRIQGIVVSAVSVETNDHGDPRR